MGRSMLLAIGAVFASALMLFCGTGLHPIWWLMWIAPVPVLIVAPRLRPSAAFGVAAGAWFLGGLNEWDYVRGIVPLGLVLLFMGVAAAVFGAIVLAYRAFVRRSALWQAVAVFPVLWVAYEYVASATSPHSTFGSIAYTQMNFLPILQLASVTGLFGISFCLFLLPAAVAVLLSEYGAATRRRTVAICTVGVLVAIVGYGMGRLYSGPSQTHQVAVALIASDARENVFPKNDTAALRLFGAYATHIGTIPAGRSVILIPEKIAVVSDEATPNMDALLQEAAAKTNALVIAGVDRGTQSRRFNEARIYTPRGLHTTYDKHHMIPGFEDADQPGTNRTFLPQPSGLWGVEVCKDMDFPALSRQYGAEGVSLLLVPAWDFSVDGWLHGRMAVMRGVESGFTLVRAAKQGLLTISDNRGRILAEQSSAAAPFSTLIADAPAAHADTLYCRWGDWFPLMNAAAAAGLLTLLLRESRKSQTA